MNKQVCNFLAKSPHLQELDLRYNKLIPKDFSHFFTVLGRDTKLVYLNLSQNSLLEDGKSQEALAAEKEAEEKAQAEKQKELEKLKGSKGTKKVTKKEVKPKASDRGEGGGAQVDEENLAEDPAQSNS
jgi:hypothetical protein